MASSIRRRTSLSLETLEDRLVPAGGLSLECHVVYSAPIGAHVQVNIAPINIDGPFEDAELLRLIELEVHALLTKYAFPDNNTPSIGGTKPFVLPIEDIFTGGTPTGVPSSLPQDDRKVTPIDKKNTDGTRTIGHEVHVDGQLVERVTQTLDANGVERGTTAELVSGGITYYTETERDAKGRLTKYIRTATSAATSKEIYRYEITIDYAKLKNGRPAKTVAEGEGGTLGDPTPTDKDLKDLQKEFDKKLGDKVKEVKK